MMHSCVHWLILVRVCTHIQCTGTFSSMYRRRLYKRHSRSAYPQMSAVLGELASTTHVQHEWDVDGSATNLSFALEGTAFLVVLDYRNCPNAERSVLSGSCQIHHELTGIHATFCISISDIHRPYILSERYDNVLLVSSPWGRHAQGRRAHVARG